MTLFRPVYVHFTKWIFHGLYFFTYDTVRLTWTHKHRTITQCANMFGALKPCLIEAWLHFNV